MIRSSKPAIKRSSTAKKSTDALRKEALAVTQANLARIDAAERGEAGADQSAPAKAPAKSKSKKSKAGKPAKKEQPARKASLLDHAANVLKESKEPMTCKAIVEKVMATTDWKTAGKTPSATLYSAVIREIATEKSQSRFKKMDRGMFARNA